MTMRLIMEEVAVSLIDRDRRFTLCIPQLEVASGSILGLTGPSGTGKTLLLELLGLLRRASTARRFVLETEGEEGLDLAAVWTSGTYSPPEVRGQVFGFVPQSGGLLSFLSVAENIALTSRISARSDPAWERHLISQLGLEDVAKLYPNSLSIGQRQRVAIARALAHRPAFVIADEPTAALDPDIAVTAMKLLVETAQDGGTGVIISSHDLALLGQFRTQRVALDLVSPPGASEAESRLFALETAT